MSAEPVAWMDSRDIEESKYEGNQYDDKPRQALMHPFVEWTIKKGLERLRFDTPLYAQSPAQARAMAIAECARVCGDRAQNWLSEKGVKSDPTGIAQAEALSCMEAIRALSSPSVTEEWVWGIATTNGRFQRINSHDEFAIVRATLAALGVEVKS